MAPLLATTLRSQRDFLVDAAQFASESLPVRPAVEPSRRDFEQMVDGFLAVLVEALEGRRPETRAFFLETVIPGLVQSGAEFGVVVHTTTTWSLLVLDHVTPLLPPEVRGEAVRWLAVFLGAWAADIARVGSKATVR